MQRGGPERVAGRLAAAGGGEGGQVAVDGRGDEDPSCDERGRRHVFGETAHGEREGGAVAGPADGAARGVDRVEAVGVVLHVQRPSRGVDRGCGLDGVELVAAQLHFPDQRPSRLADRVEVSHLGACEELAAGDGGAPSASFVCMRS